MQSMEKLNGSYYELIEDFLDTAQKLDGLDGIVKGFIRLIEAIEGIKVAGFFLYDPEKKRLRRIGGGYRKKGFKVLGGSLDLEEGRGIIWRVFKENRALILRDIRKQEEYYLPSSEEVEPGNVAFIIPLKLRGFIKGVLYLEKDEEFGFKEKKLFTLFAKVMERVLNNYLLMEEVKREREEKTLILEAIAFPIFVVDEDFNVISYNRAFLKAFNIQAYELKFKKCYQLIEKGDTVPDCCPLKGVQKGFKNITSKVRVEDRIYEMAIYRYEKGNYFVHTIKDITQLERKERVLNTLYQASLSFASANNLKIFKKKLEEFLKQEDELEVKVIWRDGIEKGFLYRKPLTLEFKGYTDFILNGRREVAFPIKYRGEEVGILILRPKAPKSIIPIDKLRFYKTFVTNIEIILQNLYLLEDLKKAINSLHKNYKATLESLSRALDFREHETEDHSRRVASYAVLLGMKLGLSGIELRNLYWGGLLHDIGKIGVPDGILLKPGKLDEREWEIMKQHPVIGYRILKNIEFLQKAIKIVLYHHERWDGRGYPEGLKGREIPLIARIFSVMDTYDAITSDRPYRKALPYYVAFEEIERNMGSQFDPDIARTFLKKISYKELEEVRTLIQAGKTPDFLRELPF